MHRETQPSISTVGDRLVDGGSVDLHNVVARVQAIPGTFDHAPSTFYRHDLVYYLGPTAPPRDHETADIIRNKENAEC